MPLKLTLKYNWYNISIKKNKRYFMKLQKQKNNKENKNLISKYGIDLTHLAKNGKIDPVIGREKEIRRMIQILSRRNKNNPVFIGEPGTGKTTIVEGLAKRIIDMDVPENIKNKNNKQTTKTYFLLFETFGLPRKTATGRPL